MKSAPILITTLCRFTHFERLVSSLSKCFDASNSVLYVYVDFPITEFQNSGYLKILNFLPTITGFKKVNVTLRDYNYGAQENMLAAKADLFKKYTHLIVLEDDNEVSLDFLNYLNSGIGFLDSHDDVFSICAYGYGKINIATKLIKYRNFSGWGYLISREKWSDFNHYSKHDFLQDLRSMPFLRLLYLNTHLKKCIIDVFNGSTAGDTRILTYLIMKSMYSLFPVLSLTRNFGHDGTGVHSLKSKENNIYKHQLIALETQEWDYLYNSNIVILSDCYSLNSYSLQRSLFISLYFYIIYFKFKFSTSNES